MESLHFRFENGVTALVQTAHLVGVVSSGNLEVLIESAFLNGACEIGITTAARGFGSTWQAVMEDFNQRWRLRDIRLSINDMGATPAVVSLRLDQAVEAVSGDRPAVEGVADSTTSAGPGTHSISEGGSQ